MPSQTSTGPDDFQLIADSAPVPMWVTKLDRSRSFVNRAYIDFVGVSYDEAIGFDWRTIIHPDDAADTLARSIAGEASLGEFTLEARYRRADGKWRWLRSVSQPRYDDGGAHVGFIGVAYDITEARAAEQAALEREAQLSAFVSQTAAGLAQVDLDGRFTFVNERFCEITGRSADELYGLTMQAITHPDHLDRNMPLFAAAVAHGTPYTHEKRYVRPDGSTVWVNNSVAVIRKSDGSPYGVLAVTIDVTARREGDAALLRSEERVRLAVQGAGMATVELDLGTLTGEWSPNRFDLLGYRRPDDHVGSYAQWLAVVHPDDLATVREATTRCFEEGTPFRIEYRILRSDTGEIRWIQSNGSRIEGRDGAAARFVGVSFDITERRRSEEELRANEWRLRFLDELGSAMATAGDADAVLGSATRMLGERLALADCAYADMEEDEDVFNIRGDWHKPGMRSIVGRYSLATFGSVAVADLHAGRPLVVNDAIVELKDDGAAAFSAIGIRATICMPLVKDGRLTALMAVHDDRPRRWTDDELGLLGEVTQRCWAHIERIRAETARQHSEQRLRLAVGAARMGTWDWDYGEGKGVWSPRTAEIMGTDQTDVTPDFHRQLVHPDDRDDIVARVAALRRVGDEFSAEYRVGPDMRGVRWVSAHGVVSGVGDAGKVQLTGMIRDVTERRRAQEALAALNDTLEQQVAERTAERDGMWRLSKDLFLVVSPGWTIRAVNPAAGAYGYAPDEVVDRRFIEFLHPDDLRAALGVIRDASRAPVGGLLARLRTKDGDWRTVSWSAVPGDGEAYVIGRDITAETQRREELEAAQDALRQAQKVESLGQLTGGVAHDFNNLLTPIIGNLDLLRRKLSDTDGAELRLIGAALDAAERARLLVQRLLAFARRQPLKVGPVDLGGLIEGMAGLIASTSGPQVDVRIKVVPGLPAAQADANQLEMALLNLSVNARDAMPNGGTLTLSADRRVVEDDAVLPPGDYVRLAVSDSGCGMDDATKARAIEPFFSTKGAGKGTGLGLSMVHGLAAQLGGTFRLDSRVGLGTTVELLLPIADEVATTPDRAAAPDAAPRSGRVLLVDDEAQVRAVTADMLAELGFEVAQAASSEDALASLAGERFDLLVTDHMMPGMTGTELAKAVRDEMPQMPILIVSGFAELDQIPTDLPRLAKPFRIDELAGELAKLA